VKLENVLVVVAAGKSEFASVIRTRDIPTVHPSVRICNRCAFKKEGGLQAPSQASRDNLRRKAEVEAMRETYPSRQMCQAAARRGRRAQTD